MAAIPPTLQGKASDQVGSTSRTPSPAKPLCICGRRHFYSECYYLRDSKPQFWKPNAKISKKVKEALKDPEFKRKVESSKQKQKMWKERHPNPANTSSTASSTTKGQSEPQNPGTFATIWRRNDAADVTAAIPTSYSVDKAINYKLINCWILDSGSNIHVCNNPD